MTEHVGLHTVPEIGRATFCGPTAIAAITGVPIAEVESAVLEHRSRRRTPRRERLPKGTRVKAMWHSEIAPVLRKLGFEAIPVASGGYTFKQFTHLLQTGTVTGPILALFTGHFVALSRWQFVDSSHRKPDAHMNYRAQRQGLKMSWKIVPLKNLTATETFVRSTQ